MDHYTIKKIITSCYLKITKKIISLSFLLFLLQLPHPQTILAQKDHYNFEHLTTKDGLSQNSVVRIFQDSRKFLWFSTFDGLNRYDGYNFKVYKSNLDDTTTISGQGFGPICEDRYGKLWIGSLDGGLNLYDSMTDTFRRFKFNPNDPHSLSSNLVKDLYLDSNGRLWIGTENGLDQFDYKTEKFIHYKFNPDNSNSLSNNFVLSIAEDSFGNIWVGTWEGLNKYNPATKKFVRYFADSHKKDCLSSDYIRSVFLDSEKKIWIVTGNGLHLYDNKNDRFISYLPDSNIPGRSYDKSIKGIWDDLKGNLWLVTSEGGLCIFNKSKNTFTNFKNDPYDSHSLSNNNTLSIYKDVSGIIWIGTDGSGINKLIPRNAQFNNYSVRPDKLNQLNNNSIYSFYEDKSGDIWIATYGGGINIFNPDKDKEHFIKYLHNPGNKNSLSDNKVRGICKDKHGDFWIGTERGLDRFDPKNKIFHHYNNNIPSTHNTSAISTVYVTSSDEILAGTFNSGLRIYNRRNDNFTIYMNKPESKSSLSGNTIRKIFEDRSGIVWICTNKGLDRFDRQKNQFIHYQNNPLNSFSIVSNNILNIFQDNSGTLWVGTNLGLNKITGDIANNRDVKFIRYSMKNGLPDNSIQSILEDNHGNLWIGTNNGLSKFNPQSGTFKNFTTDDGLSNNEFYINSCLKRKSTGEFLFGGYNGFCLFQPDSIKDDLYIPPVIFTDFYLFNLSVRANSKINGRIILTKTIWETGTITLPYQDNIISFEFSALDYASPNGNKYSYIMEGLENNWNNVGNRHYASFTNLPPGEYVFKVKAANACGIWNNTGASVKIIVLPPYWETWWFRIICGMLIGSFILISYKIKVANFVRRKKELEDLIREKSVLNDQLRLEIIEHENAEVALKEAKEEAEKSDKLKSEFLAQVSHEIRTPINAILSFSSLIREDVSQYLSSDMKDGFSIIDRSGKRLIRTVDLILNMSLLQSDSFELSFLWFDLYQIVLERKIKEYSILAEEKGLQFKVTKKTDNCFIYSDDTIIDQIFDNLLNNAIKFTRQGCVGINIFNNEMKHLVVEIYDTGIGISEDYMPNLFKPFSQEEGGYARRFEGNGLGLALTKKYCDLTSIKIDVQSKKGNGTKFTLTFL